MIILGRFVSLIILFLDEFGILVDLMFISGRLWVVVGLLDDDLWN